MNKQVRDNLLKGLADNNREGEALRDFIQEKIKELDTVEGAEDMGEVKGREKAIEKLKEIFKFLTPQKPIIKKTNTQYL